MSILMSLGIPKTAMVYLLPGGMVISGEIKGIHICSIQALHWCLTRLGPLLFSHYTCSLGIFKTSHGWVFNHMLITFNLSSPFVQQTLMFLHKLQHVWQASHHGWQHMSSILIPAILSFCSPLDMYPHVRILWSPGTTLRSLYLSLQQSWG